MPILPVLALVAPLLGGHALSQSPLDPVSPQNRAQAAEHYREGLARLRAESWPEAEREFQAAVKLDPMMVMAHYGLGQARMNLKRYPDAAEAFLGCREAHLRLASLQQTDRALAEQRRDDEIRELEDSVRLYRSGTVKASNTQSMILRLETRLQQLQTDRRRGTQTVEVPSEFSLALGSAYFRSGNLEEAERAYREAVKVNAKMGEAHNNLAVIYLMKGRLDEAEKEMKAAEKSGYAVNPRFKDDLKAKLKAPPR
jgi:Flp pilus assembly protein TadD